MRKRRKNKRKSIFSALWSPLRESSYGGKPDYVLLGSVSIILVLGLLMLSSATAIIAFERSQDTYFFVRQQLSHGLLPGIVLFFIAIHLDFSIFKKFKWTFFSLTVGLLLVVFIPGLASVRNNVSSWISIGPISLQTSDLAKITFIFWLSSWLISRQKSMDSFTATTLPFIVFVGFVAGLLMMQPDMGTMMIFVVIALAIFVASNAKILHIITLGIMGCLGLVAMILQAPYRFERVKTLFNPEADILGTGYQVYQALLAIGSGSWFGVGIGQSRQKFNYLPEVAGDSIFAIIGEELGYVFSAAIIVLFFIVSLRGLKIAKEANSLYLSLIAIGITTLVAFQVLINIGSMLGLVPLTGIPLPFISLGGTNLAVLLASMGVLTSISKQTYKHNE